MRTMRSIREKWLGLLSIRTANESNSRQQTAPDSTITSSNLSVKFLVAVVFRLD